MPVKILLVCAVAAGVSAMFTATSVGTEPNPSPKNKRVVCAPVARAPASGNPRVVAHGGLDELSQLPADIEVRQHVVVVGGSDTGNVAAADEGTLVYSNTLGKRVLGPPASAPTAFALCNTAPANDHCWDPDPFKGARLVSIPSSTEGDALHATEDSTDPGFCCHGGLDCPGGICNTAEGLCEGGDRDGKPCDPELFDNGPGSPGYGTVWYKFVASDTSVELLTCNSFNPPEVNDSLISVYTPANPDRGICDDMSVCSVSAQDCADGSECLFDEQYACEHLNLIGCSDDVDGCSSNNANASLCLTGLEIGQTYYVLVGAKLDVEEGEYLRLSFNLEVYADCTLPEPPMPNDFCQKALELVGDQVVEPFDLSGELFGVAPATFHCPGEPEYLMLQNDLWYDWFAPGSGEATVSTCDENLSPEDQPNTTLCVYDGCDCPLEVGALIDCNFGTFDECGNSATVTFEPVVGECYKIRLGGHFGSTPAGWLSVILSGVFPDCNGNGVPDDEDIANGTSGDCQPDGIPDECQVPPIDSLAPDCNQNDIPDECEVDSDGDGLIDDCDGCPDDPNKIEPGVCGCGVPDDDSDGDGVEDCSDGCPDDPNKIEPGICGCGVPDDDSDGDGVEDCNDGCPDDPNKIEPGVCGCGVAFCLVPFPGGIVRDSPEPANPGRETRRGPSTPAKE
ncbi:MAG: hypothetical protein WBE26_08060 [Phycisphaerae bacterium]